MLRALRSVLCSVSRHPALPVATETLPCPLQVQVTPPTCFTLEKLPYSLRGAAMQQVDPQTFPHCSFAYFILAYPHAKYTILPFQCL